MTSRSELLKIEERLRTIQKRQTTRKLDFYAPYPKQRDFHAAGSTFRERLFMAGNRCGKTYCGAAEVAMHLTGIYPDDWTGRRFARPIEAWVASDTATSTRDIMQNELCGPPGDTDRQGTGAIPKACVDWNNDCSLARGVTDLYDTVLVKHVSGGKSRLQFKSYDQGRRKFQGTAKDVIWGDEEPPEDVYTEMLARIAPRRKGEPSGIALITFTPLQGLSGVVMKFIQESSPDRHVTNMTIDEAEHIDPVEREKIVAGYPEHEREARAGGQPLRGSGIIFREPESNIMVTPFEIPMHWPRMWGMDFGTGHPFAAVLGAWDRDADVIYFVHCIRMANKLPIDHAAAMKPFGKGIPAAWPQDGHQRIEFDGKLLPLAKIYKAHGVAMRDHHAMWPDGSNSTEVGIVEMQERERSGRLKVFSTCQEYFEERRFYHRKDGLIVKVRDDLMSAARIWVMAKRFAKLSERYVQQVTGGNPTIAAGADPDPYGF